MTKTAIGINRPLLFILTILEPDSCDEIYHFTIDELMQVNLKRCKQFVDMLTGFLIALFYLNFYRTTYFDEEQR